MSYYLGIDIGTTKVATVICNTEGGIVEYQSLATKADIDTSPEQSEQDSGKIFSTVDTCIDALDENNLKKIVSIGVTGQMHGVILWGKSKISHLITWQDKRCNGDEFLDETEKKTGEKLSSGFGSASLAWTVKYGKLDPDYQHAATIHDYLVTCLCNLQHPVMDPTNAASWGLFDIFSQKWQKTNIDKLNIPYNFYPEIVPSGSVAGKLNSDYAEKWGINADIPVTVAIGDNQASLLATIKQWDKEISLTIGTGAQVSVILPPESDLKHNGINNRNIKSENYAQNVQKDIPNKNAFAHSLDSSGSCELRPFINGSYIAVAAPLCGGSAFAWLIDWFTQWCDTLGMKIPENTNLYDFFIKEGLKQGKNDLCIEPNFLGERYNSELRGKITNITLDNFTPGNVALALNEGIIRNLKSMIPDEFLNSKERIIASGNALRRTPLLVQAAEGIFGKPVEVIDSCEEAACGAAMLCLISSRHNNSIDYSRFCR